MKLGFSIVLLFLVGAISIFIWNPEYFVDVHLEYGGESIESREVFATIYPFGYKKRLTDTKKNKRDLRQSPDEKYLAFIEDVMLEISEREWALKMVDLRTLSVRTVYIGDYHTNRYEWIDKHTLRIFVDAGTGVGIYKDFDASIIAEAYVMSDRENLAQEWTPFKRMTDYPWDLDN